MFQNIDLNNSNNLFNNNSLNLTKEISFVKRNDENNSLFFNNNDNINNNNINNINLFQENSKNIIINNNINNERISISNDSNVHQEDNNSLNEERKEEEVGRKIKISEELNKPDELGRYNDDNDYIRLLNEKIKKYKKELDSKVEEIEVNKSHLFAQEKKFNNFIDAINTSNKII